MIKKFLFLIFFSFPAFAFTIPENLTQGMLVYGTADENEEIYYEDLPVPVYNGKYVFALGRNAPDEIQITIKRGWFDSEKKLFKVAPREWQKDVFDGVPEKTMKPSEEDSKRIAEEQKLLDAARAKRPIKNGFPTCFIKPVEETRISSAFGSQRIINGVPQRPHSGVDMAAPEGTPVKASADGVVILAHDDLFYTGGTVLIEHGNGVQTGYSHLSKVDVKTGDIVKQGDVVGSVGMTGRANGPHLHFTLAWENIRVAPEFEYCTSCPCGDK
ncbi:MAG: M23 family metallopeptidase [Alphaproteobacteria bacterium]|nr:M23 family metallopeptidase [Alphaproteobacteria bacterium]